MREYASYILTDTLPAELPIIFSNRTFYEYLCNKGEALNGNLESKYTIPIQFRVRKNDVDYRTISLMNPISEIEMLNFIYRYSDLLLIYLENNSVFSIRRYNKINNVYIKVMDEDIKELKAMIDPDTFDVKGYSEDKLVRSFFNIVRFPKITDFYRSFVLKDLELQYKYMLKMDIENCFGNIYTHSVDWAFLGEKITAKKNIDVHGKRFSSLLDSIMQRANYNETHGILVGPEFSRMFAEIILTRVDRNVYDELKRKKFYYKKDYEIVRFIDDIFVFASSRDALECIEIVIKEKIKEYKLVINTNKQFFERAPFLRNHLWVTEAKRLLKAFEDGCNKLSDGRTNKAFIDICYEEIRGLCVKFESQKQYILAYMFTALERIQDQYIEGIQRLCRNRSQNDEDENQSFVRHMQAKWIDLVAGCLVLSITHNNAIKYSRMCIKFLKVFAKEEQSAQIIVFKKGIQLLKYHRDAWTELQNVLILLALVNERLIPPTLLIDLLNEDRGYLSVSTIVYYIKKQDPKRLYYADVYEKINNIIDEELVVCGNLYNIDYNSSSYGNFQIEDWIRSDHFYMIHDIYSADVVDKENKRRIDVIKKACKNHAGSAKVIIKSFSEFIKDFDKPFMKWTCSDEELITDFFLEKKYKRFEYD